MGYAPLERSFRSFAMWGAETALRIGARRTLSLFDEVRRERTFNP
jgi:hypothetical protein